MYISASDLTPENAKLKYLVQVSLRIHGFEWRSRYGIIRCESIYQVRLRGRHIVVTHTPDSGIYKTVATWTRIHIPQDPEAMPITVRVRPGAWPPEQLR